jgi:hypothetical protein
MGLYSEEMNWVVRRKGGRASGMDWRDGIAAGTLSLEQNKTTSLGICKG